MAAITAFMHVVRVQYINSSSGQFAITIPKKLVEKYNLQKGSEVIVLDDGDSIRLIPAEIVRNKILMR